MKTPGTENLAPPRYWSNGDAAINGTNEDGNDFIKAWKKSEEWTGPEMPLVAQWQGHGLTVQVFFAEHFSCPLLDERPLRDNYKKRYMQWWFAQSYIDNETMDVIVRVIDGDRKIIEDRSAFYVKGFGPGLSTPRTSNPSRKRTATERKLTASILHRLADMANELGSRVRYDWGHGNKYLNKQEQAWIGFNCQDLRRIAHDLEVAENHE